MKRYLSILLAAVTIFTIGCRKDNTKDNENKDTKASPTMILTATVEVQPSKTPMSSSAATADATKSPEPQGGEEVTETASPAPTESAENTEKPSVTQAVSTSTPTLVPSVNPTQTVAPTITPTVKPTQAPTLKPTATVNPTVKPTVKPTSAPTSVPMYRQDMTDEEKTAYFKYAAAETVKAINKRRNVQLIVLPGLTEYAEYRAMQLETNFAHDSADQKAASKALQYGEYTNNPPSQAALDILLQYNPNYVYEPSYFVPAAEAISGNIDGENCAAGLERSPGHWRYVGSDEYLYIGVGVSEAGTCVCVAKVNTDLLK